jgi:hypothetical protein
MHLMGGVKELASVRGLYLPAVLWLGLRSNALAVASKGGRAAHRRTGTCLLSVHGSRRVTRGLVPALVATTLAPQYPVIALSIAHGHSGVRPFTR